VITGDKLQNYDELFNIGSQVAIGESIKSSKKGLLDRLFSLEENGSTALGPALIVCLGMAERYPGSKIVVCTGNSISSFLNITPL
jgi:hypothetical protein